MTQQKQKHYYIATQGDEFVMGFVCAYDPESAAKEMAKEYGREIEESDHRDIWIYEFQGSWPLKTTTLPEAVVFNETENDSHIIAVLKDAGLACEGEIEGYPAMIIYYGGSEVPSVRQLV